jgi:hypothetical protein
MMKRATAEHAARGLRPRQRFALVDPIPDALRSLDDPARPGDLIVTRPVAHRGTEAAKPEPQLPTGRPLVLVTVGTSVREPELLAGLVGSVVDASYEVAVTTEPGTLSGNPRVHEIGFVPLALQRCRDRMRRPGDVHGGRHHGTHEVEFLADHDVGPVLACLVKCLVESEIDPDPGETFHGGRTGMSGVSAAGTPFSLREPDEDVRSGVQQEARPDVSGYPGGG